MKLYLATVFEYLISRFLMWSLALYLIFHVRNQALYQKIIKIDVDAAALASRYISWKTRVPQKLIFHELLGPSLSFLTRHRKPK